MCDGTRTGSNKATVFAASADAIMFKHLQLNGANSNKAKSNKAKPNKADLSGSHSNKSKPKEGGLRISQKMLAKLGAPPNAEAMMFVREGELVITTNPARIALLKSAEELQLRQDELKEDHSAGIVALLNRV